VATEPLFWQRMAVYWQEWADCILWEVEGSKEYNSHERRPFADEYVRISAHKAAALKICPTAMALLAGRPDLIPALEEAVDGMHAAMQLVDDLFDWQEYYQHGRYNAVLGLMISQGLLDPMAVKAGTDRLSTAVGVVHDGEIERLALIVLDERFSQDYLQAVRRFADQAMATIDSLQTVLGRTTPASASIEPWARLVNGLVEQTRHRIGLYRQVVHGLNSPVFRTYPAGQERR
jgi:geranylgeranyl pyrophosphate synthase